MVAKKLGYSSKKFSTDPRGDLKHVDVEQISRVLYHLHAYGALITALNNLSDSKFLMAVHLC